MNAAQSATSKQARAAELGDRIRNASADSPVEVSLSTSQRIIARVTDGIYREPWAAFRELCANAYDADATRVVIETGAPRFDQIVIRDDGRGMSPETLAYVVENIGGSSKRTQDGVALHTANAHDPDLSIGERPLIGKIGIGLFAVAQLTQHFQIITKAKGERFRTWATVVLKTHNEAALKRAEGKPFEAGTASIVSEPVPETEVEAHGTTIVLHDLRPEIRNLLQSSSRWQAGREIGPVGEAMVPPPVYHIGRVAGGSDSEGVPPRFPWKDAVDPLERFKALFAAASETGTEASKSPSLEHLDEYLQSIWKLSLSLPLDYIDEHPFDASTEDGFIFLDPGKSGRAEEINLLPRETIRGRYGMESGRPDPVGGFDILFDGVLLRRPIELPKKLNRKSRIAAPVFMAAKVDAPFSEASLERAGGRLRFEVYLYWNSIITPKDIQGALIRVREASGTLFDKRFLNYQVSEQNRLSQITAEIFVLEGLDGAINIDRESFNYSHPHYIFIQKWLHRALRILVNKLKLIAKEHAEKEKTEKKEAANTAIVDAALEVWSKNQGIEADPPSALAARSAQGATYHVPHWLDGVVPADLPMASAIGVVLEAYGIFNDLRIDRKQALVNDLIKVIRVPQSN